MKEKEGNKEREKNRGLNSSHKSLKCWISPNALMHLLFYSATDSLSGEHEINPML